MTKMKYYKKAEQMYIYEKQCFIACHLLLFES